MGPSNMGNPVRVFGVVRNIFTSNFSHHPNIRHISLWPFLVYSEDINTSTCRRGHSTYLNTTSCGTLHVRTIQDLKYIITTSFTRLIITRPGEKNIPIHTCPWLLISIKMFSAILKSPYLAVKWE